MAERDHNREASLGRRELMRGMGLAALGGVVGGGSARRARASVGPAPGAWPETTVLELAAGRAVLRTGPFQSFDAVPGGRVGLCFLVAGGTRGSGPKPAIRAVGQAEANVAGLGSFTADPGVEQRVYRLLDGLDTVRPVELFGLSAEVDRKGLEPGQSIELTWQASLRGSGLSRSLESFHACVLGALAADARFVGQLSYIELSRRT